MQAVLYTTSLLFKRFTLKNLKRDLDLNIWEEGREKNLCSENKITWK